MSNHSRKRKKRRKSFGHQIVMFLVFGGVLLAVLFFAIDSDTQLVVRQFVNRVTGGAEPTLDRENANMEGGAQEPAVTATEGANASVEGDAVVVDLKKTFELLASDNVITTDEVEVPAEEIDFNDAKLTLTLKGSNDKAVNLWEFELMLNNASQLRIQRLRMAMDLFNGDGNYVASERQLWFGPVFPSKPDSTYGRAVVNGERIKQFTLRFNELSVSNSSGDQWIFKPTSHETPFGISYELYDADKKELASGKQYFNPERIRRLE